MVVDDTIQNMIDLIGDFLAARSNGGFNFLSIFIDYRHRMKFLRGDQQFIVGQLDRQRFERFSNAFDIIDGQRDLIMATTR